MDTEEGGRGRLGPGDWVAAALAGFVAEGPAGIRVEALARAIGATKGSFYWHFKDAAALRAAVLQRLEEELSALSEGPAENPRRRVMVLVLAPEPPALVALRDWARTDPAAGPSLRAIDQARLAALRAALVACGVDAGEASRGARLLLAARAGFDRLRLDGAEDWIERHLRHLARAVLDGRL